MKIRQSRLHKAAFRGDLGIVTQLVGRYKHDLEALDGDFFTPLHSASFNGHTAVMEYLIDQGAKVNVKDNDKLTPLHYCASLDVDDPRGVQLLLRKGAIIDAKDNTGLTPLHWAVSYGLKRISKYLIRKGANVNAAENDGRTPLHYAAHFGYKIILDDLILNGAFIHVKDKNGKEPQDVARRGCSIPTNPVSIE